jgi:sulfane dehydrogenase subunit SoxC
MDKAHTAFRYLWDWNGQPTEILSRTVDETSYVQSFLKDLLTARSGNMGYHYNPVTAWYIQDDGQILFKAT